MNRLFCAILALVLFGIPGRAQTHSGGGGGGGGGGVTTITPTSPITASGTTTVTVGCATCAIGPGASTANHLAKFSGTDGLTLADGGAITSGTVTSAVIAGTANQIGTAGTCTITSIGTCTLSLLTAQILGTDNSTAGTIQMANGSANAHTIWGSAATTSNTILGFTVVPTTGHLVTCTTSGIICTLTDGGAIPTGTVTSIATTSPITGGTITATGTVGCATCAIGPGASTANHLAKFSGTDGVTLIDGGVSSGGGGIGGSTANVVGPDGVANLLNFNGGAKGVSVADAAMATKSTVYAANGSSASPATPTGTTSFNNEVVISVYNFYTTLTAPGTPTVRKYVAGVTSVNLGIWAGDQTVATAGAYAANTATQTSGPWTALTIPLIPTAGQTLSFVAASSTAYATTSMSITKPTGTGTYLNEAEFACIGQYGGYIAVTPPWGWQVFAPIFNSTTNVETECWVHRVGASEPSSYVFTFSYSAAIADAIGFILDYQNVGGIDNAVTSATASFSSADLGSWGCLWGLTTASSNSVAYHQPICDKIEFVGSSTAIYPLYTNITAASLSSQVFVKAADSTAAMQSAQSALTGGTIYMPAGIYACTAPCLTWPRTNVLNMVGAGASATQYNAPGSGNYAPLAPNGSTLVVMGDAAGDPAFAFPPSTVSSQIIWGIINHLADFSLIGTQGTADAVDYYQTHADFERLAIQGFGGDGFLLSSADPGSGQGYVGSVLVRACYILLNGRDGVEINGTGTFEGESNNVLYNEIDENGRYSIEIDGPNTTSDIGFNLIQWSVGSCQMSVVSGAGDSTVIQGNWFEAANLCVAGQGGTITDNHFQGTSAITTAGSATGWTVTGNEFDTGPALSGTWHTPTVNSTGKNNGYNNTFAGQTAGTASCLYAASGGVAQVSCNLVAYQMTGTAQTWTFPVPQFVAAPVNSASTLTGSCGTYNPTATATTLTLPANAAMTAESCMFTLTGLSN